MSGSRKPGAAPGSRVVLLKLGGSLITVKTRPYTVRRNRLRRIAQEIASAKRRSGLQLIVGHGSGSFGHVVAAAHGVHRGVRSRRQLSGVAATQAAAARLHTVVLQALCDAGLPAYSFAPSSSIVADNGRPVRVGAEPLLRALQLGLVPVTYGDVVMDREQGACICSTETTFLALVRALRRAGVRVERVLWFGDAAGVLDEQGRLVPHITPRSARAVLAATGGSRATDVTGGMRHRLETALRLARFGVPSWIAGGVESGMIRDGLLGRGIDATRVEAGS